LVSGTPFSLDKGEDDRVTVAVVQGCKSIKLPVLTEVFFATPTFSFRVSPTLHFATLGREGIQRMRIQRDEDGVKT
jgi:hypothetical protein